VLGNVSQQAVIRNKPKRSKLVARKCIFIFPSLNNELYFIVPPLAFDYLARVKKTVRLLQHRETSSFFSGY